MATYGYKPWHRCFMAIVTPRSAPPRCAPPAFDVARGKVRVLHAIDCHITAAQLHHVAQDFGRRDAGSRWRCEDGDAVFLLDEI